MRAGLLLAVLTLIATGTSAQAPDSASAFDLFFIGHQIGREATTIRRDAAGSHLASAFHFEDRGTPIDLTAALDLDPAGQPTHFLVSGRNYRLFASDAEVTIASGRAHVRDLAAERDVVVGAAPFFPIDNYAPIHVQQELLKYWVAHGRPEEIASAPAGPIRIRTRGRADGLERVSIDGVVWGTETAWFEPETGRLRALTTWAGALPFQARAADDQRNLEAYLADAVSDRMADLRALTASVPVKTGGYVIEGATLIDATGRAPIQNAALVVSPNGRITYAGPASGAPALEGVARIDARGRWIIPGLWDMHAHASQTDWAAAYLANGVTTIRDMGGEEGFLIAMRDEIASGRALGPRYLLAGLLDGPGPRSFGAASVSTEADARAVVQRYKQEGFDEIKIYIQTPPALVPVITAEAHRLGMTVTGHVPQGMTAQQLVEQGFDGIAHMQLRGQPGSEQADALIALFKRHATIMDPTMSWNELSGRPASLPLNDLLPGAAGLPRPLARMFASMSPGRGNSQQAGLQLLKQARDAGLLVVPGTDKGVPGLSLPRELELYVQGGMSPLEAIQAGSRDSARAMRLDADAGTLEAGKRADFIVLDADPLEDIRNLRRASRVAANGRLYSTADLFKAAGFIR
jgi:imidazolonepropionase-like amidohydrolase